MPGSGSGEGKWAKHRPGGCQHSAQSATLILILLLTAVWSGNKKLWEQSEAALTPILASSDLCCCYQNMRMMIGGQQDWSGSCVLICVRLIFGSMIVQASPLELCHFLCPTSQLAMPGHHWYCLIHCIMQAFFVLSFLQCQTKNFHFIQLYVPNKIIFRHCILYKESKYWIAARWIEEFRYELANTRWNCFKLLERLLGCGGNSLESESLREEKNFPEIRLIFPGESLPPS